LISGEWFTTEIDKEFHNNMRMAVVAATHSVKISNNIASPDVYKFPITLSQWISADCTKITDNIASVEM